MLLPIKEFLIIGKPKIPTVKNVGHVERPDILLQAALRKKKNKCNYGRKNPTLYMQTLMILISSITHS